MKHAGKKHHSQKRHVLFVQLFTAHEGKRAGVGCWWGWGWGGMLGGRGGRWGGGGRRGKMQPRK